jgi:hypothetical protein
LKVTGVWIQKVNMTLQQISQRLRVKDRGSNYALYLVLAGLMIEMTALIIGIALGISYADYWGNSKAVRDAAGPGSNPGILSQVGTIVAVEAWLVPFKFLGLAMFFSGIAVALATIIKTLQLRGDAFALSLSTILGSGSGADGGNA